MGRQNGGRGKGGPEAIGTSSGIPHRGHLPCHRGALDLLLRLIEWIAPDAAAIGWLQTAKGWFYVIVTALLVFLLAGKYVELAISRQNALIERERELAEKRDEATRMDDIAARIWRDEEAT